MHTLPSSTVAPARSVRAFARHYAEMLVAMVLGMIVLGVPAGAALAAMGVSSSALQNDAPAVMLIGMAVTMTVPMVGWMRYRGHRWPASMEMAASMFVPAFAVVGLLAAGVVTDFGALMTIEHATMLPAMVGVMLLRLDEYAHHH